MTDLSEQNNLARDHPDLISVIDNSFRTAHSEEFSVPTGAIYVK